MDNYLTELNQQQRDAVLYCDGPSLVIAGAGSGKTRVLTYKIVHLLNLGYNPSRILALTFTNKAAKEMKERIAQLIGEEKASKLWMGTFHSIFLKIIRFNCERLGFKSDFTIYDSADSKSLIKMLIKGMNLSDDYKPTQVQNVISKAKNSLYSPVSYANDADFRKADKNAGVPEIHRIFKLYAERCKAANAMDFDDILYYINVLFRDNPDLLQKYSEYFEYILVDEYQDTNFAQHTIIEQLSHLSRKICVVGDDAQSIYSFRGANIGNILSLEKRFPGLKTFKLEQNYRSTQNILNAANSLIDKNSRQIRKHIFSNNAIGDRISVIKSYSGYEEGALLVSRILKLKARQSSSYDDFAILYRTNVQSRLLEEAFRKRNVPYRIYGGLSFYQRKEVKDLISYFRLSVNPDDDEAFKRIINYPARGIGETTVGKIYALASQLNCSMWEVATKYIDDININKGIKNKISQFTGLVHKFIESNANSMNANVLAEKIVEETNVIGLLRTENTPENISRIENINELVNAVTEFVNGRIEEGNDDISLSHFLSEVSLRTDQDEDGVQSEGSRVTFMTIHAAKGLEFRNIFVVGLEDQIFPSPRSSYFLPELEEERRLMYVAITRAKETCTLSYAESRFVNGKTEMHTPSRFLNEISPKFLNVECSTTSQYNSMSFEPTIIPRSSFIPQIARPAQNTQTNNDSEMTIHHKSELSVGMIIVHQKFGRGMISDIDDSGSNTKIIVSFESESSNKTLLLKFAKFKIEK